MHNLPSLHAKTLPGMKPTYEALGLPYAHAAPPVLNIPACWCRGSFRPASLHSSDLALLFASPIWEGLAQLAGVSNAEYVRQGRALREVGATFSRRGEMGPSLLTSAGLQEV